MAEYLKGLFGGQKPVPSATSDDGKLFYPSQKLRFTDIFDVV